MSLLISILFFLLVLGKHRLGLRLGISLQMGAKLLLCCIPMAQDGRADVLLGWVLEETLQGREGGHLSREACHLLGCMVKLWPLTCGAGDCRQDAAIQQSPLKMGSFPCCLTRQQLG